MGNKKKTADGEAGKVQEMDTGRRVCKTPWMSRGDGKETTVKDTTDAIAIMYETNAS